MGWATAGLVLLVVGLLSVVFYTSVGTRFAVEVGASFYDDMIPADVELGVIDGSLASGVTINDLKLADAQGVPLVEVGLARLAVDPLALLRLRVETGTVRLEDVEVYLLDSQGGGFADLAPPDDGVPAEPSATFGPDLPVSIVGRVELRRARISNGSVEGPETLLELPELDLALQADGLHAAVQLEGRLWMPSQSLRVHWVELRARWDEPVATIDSLAVQSNAGDVRARGIELDVSTAHVDLPNLEIEAAPTWLHEQVELSVQGPPRLHVSASGVPGALSADVELVVPGLAALAAVVDGALEPTLELRLWADAEVQAVAANTEVLAPALALETSGTIAGDPTTALGLAVDTRCDGCVTGLGALESSVRGFVAPGDRWGWVDASVRAPHLDIEVGAGAVPDGPIGVVADVDIEQLGALSPLLERIAPGSPIAGALSFHTACVGLESDLSGGCDVSVQLKQGRPVEALELHAAGWTRGGEELQLAIETLKAAERGHRLTLRQAPALFRVHPEQATVDGLRLTLASPTGSGNIAVDGQLGLVAPQSVDARVAINGLSLAAVNAFVPSLDASGMLDLDATLRGPLRAPRATLSSRGTDLRALGIGIGTTEVTANYADSRAVANVSVDGADVGNIDIDADAGVLVDLEQAKFGLLPERTAHISLTLEDVPLATAGRLAPAARGLEGRLGATVVASGRPHRPRIRAELGLAAAHFQGRRLPDVDIDARYADDLATAQLRATHPTAFEELTLDADVPIALNLRRGHVKWKADAPHEIALRVRDGNLGEITRWQPQLPTTGSVDVEVDISGDMVNPAVEARVNVDELGFDGRTIGDLAFGFDYAEELARLRLEGSGPAVSGVGLTADVPVTLSPARGAVRWHDTEPHRVRLSVNELLVDRALQWVPRSAKSLPAVRGRVDLLAALDGLPSQPVVRVESTIDNVEIDGRAVGQLVLDANYDDARATAQLGWDKTQRHSALVTADIPVMVDLAKQEFAWSETDPHHMRIGIPRIDAELLSAFIDVGEFDGALALYAVVDGHPDEFDASASASGVVRSNGTSHRVRADFDASEVEQTLVLDVGGSGTQRLAHVQASASAAVPQLAAGADWKPTPFSVQVDIDDVDLRTVAPFTPADVQDLRGVLSAHATANGSLGAPKVGGDIRLTNTAATVVPLRQRLENVEVIASLHDDTIELTRLRLQSGGGKVSGSGRWIVASGFGLDGAATIDIDRIPLRSPGMPRMTFSGQIATKLAIGLDATAVGVALRDARVDVFTDTITAAKTIPSNENVQFVDLDAPPIEAAPPAKSVAPSSTRTTKVEVRLADPVAIIGPAIDMRWKGSVTATSGPGDVAKADGTLEAEGGRFDLLGNDFQIERGNVTLTDDGSNVPFVDVVAVTSVDDITITATVRGPLPRPELVLSSSPSMSQSDIFTVLVTGSADTQDADPDEVEAKAASVLAALSNPALQQQLNSKLRVDKVGVGFGESTDQPILTVGKHVSKRVYAETEYHHNAPKTENRAEVRVEYRFWPRWSIETFFGDAAAGGVDLLWGRAFDTKRSSSGATKPDVRPQGPDKVRRRP